MFKPKAGKANRLTAATATAPAPNITADLTIALTSLTSVKYKTALQTKYPPNPIPPRISPARVAALKFAPTLTPLVSTLAAFKARKAVAKTAYETYAPMAGLVQFTSFLCTKRLTLATTVIIKNTIMLISEPADKTVPITAGKYTPTSAMVFMFPVVKSLHWS